MMDFISIPLTVGIVFFGIYKLFELFVKRRERLLIIDKEVNNPSVSNLDGKHSFSLEFESKNPFGILKIACLLTAVGLGILCGFLIHTLMAFENFHNDITGLIFGSTIFIFGGLRLLLSFFIEMKHTKKKELQPKEETGEERLKRGSFYSLFCFYKATR